MKEGVEKKSRRDKGRRNILYLEDSYERERERERRSGERRDGEGRKKARERGRGEYRSTFPQGVSTDIFWPAIESGIT
eukprot:1371479-Amorphochlora_amoeboformis.AAC.1